ncbi:acylneuraminate cytidylyltransferase family protein [Sediminibacterium roseum]|uniref:Acylneuraminate cytidylyltransferase family protein n=1 Tax=Sediminibacterium roseum TaxID=1978412 RepID=A0ABW9ZVH1_9BACT|nr:acylneuraminate cytidylyltransferase family protein [Sediminibacterium roseum]NCI49055.1 acylneuraminate cytidylyltransferase family protein [Sediminibacterium roseum]
MRLAVIPARGGSKGLPGKNTKVLNGKPLVAWSIESALASELIDRVVVSTDSEEIKTVALRFGAEVIDRPAELATDEATTIAVLEHTAKEVPAATQIIVLQPTSPLRDKGLLDTCIRLYESGGYTNLATGFWCKYQEFGSHNNMRRQDYKGFFYDDGNVYILPRELVLTGRWSGSNPCKFPIEKHMNFEIDDAIDFIVLEALMKTVKK